MPYIEQDARNKYLPILKEIQQIETKGDLEYCITVLMNIFMFTREHRYSPLHDCVYATMHCADEFRRRHLDKREDIAIEMNGDIE